MQPEHHPAGRVEEGEPDHRSLDSGADAPRVSSSKHLRVGTILGTLAATATFWFIVVTTNSTLHAHGVTHQLAISARRAPTSHPLPPWPSVEMAKAMNRETKGVAIPSFNPLSMFKVGRMRTGTSVLLNVGSPSAASVDASDRGDSPWLPSSRAALFLAQAAAAPRKSSVTRTHQGASGSSVWPAAGMTTSFDPRVPSWSICAWCIGTARSCDPATISIDE